MLVGICSDSHDRFKTLRRALALFDGLGVERVIHCGDVGGEAAFGELAGREVRFVWGNTDEPSAGLMAFVERLGLTPPGAPPLRLEWAGKTLEVFHGHEPQFARAVQARAGVDYLLHGHTHIARDERMGGVRIINPGALHRARRKTVATLDLSSDQLRFHDVEE